MQLLAFEHLQLLFESRLFGQQRPNHFASLFVGSGQIGNTKLLLTMRFVILQGLLLGGCQTLGQVSVFLLAESEMVFQFGYAVIVVEN